jgi:hypothetical protein
VVGLSESDDVIFSLKGQRFGFSLKYYKARQIPNDVIVSPWGAAEGAYIFTPLENKSFKYSNVNPDIIYEQGRFVEQWTIKFEGKKEKEFAIARVRAIKDQEMIEFDVELNSIPLEDG